MSPSTEPPAKPGTLRRSTRLRAKANARRPAPRLLEENKEAEDVAEYIDLDDDDHRSSKRRKTNHTTSDKSAERTLKKGSKRSLSKLPEMPIDILFLIFGELDPLDLVHLARSTKALRRVLMHRSSITVWKQARNHFAGLPGCPPDLSEPQYANLVFDPHCHFCLKQRVYTVLWNNRVRCCKDCIDKNFMDMGEMYSCLYPFISEHKRPQPWGLLGCDPFRNKHYYLRSEVVQLLQQYQQIGSDTEKLESFECKKVKVAKKISKHADLVKSWHNKQTFLRALELDDLRFKRRQGIVKKLLEMGYGEELEMMDDEMIEVFLNHPSVKQPKELTDRIWNNIKEPIIEIILLAKAIHVAKARAILLVPHLSLVAKSYVELALSRPHTEYLPRVTDFCLMPEVKAILDSASDEDVTETKITELRPRFLELCERWRQACSRQLLQLLPTAAKTNQANDDDISPLQLATTWFNCLSCVAGSELIGYPRILAHSCMRESTLDGDVSLDLAHTPEADARNLIRMLYEEEPWHIDEGVLKYNERAAATVTAVIRACGKDPAITTGREMDALDARVVCVGGECLRGGIAHIVTWRTAIQHDVIFHPDGPTEWLRLNRDDTYTMTLMEESDTERLTMEIWSCTRCRSSAVCTDVVKAHVKEQHNVRCPIEGQDYAVHHDKDPGPPRPFIVPAVVVETPAFVRLLDDVYV